MDAFAHHLFLAIPIGIGATVAFDVWALALKLALGIPPSNICLVGRWVLYMGDGVFRHSSISSAPPKRSECMVGWVSHYAIGVMLASVFVAFVGATWLQQPKLLPAIAYGLITVVAPFCIMQPSFGLGFAASRTAKPWSARLRSIMNHLAYGAGLYLSAVLINWLQRT